MQKYNSTVKYFTHLKTHIIHLHFPIDGNAYKDFHAVLHINYKADARYVIQ